MAPKIKRIVSTGGAFKKHLAVLPKDAPPTIKKLTNKATKAAKPAKSTNPKHHRHRKDRAPSLPPLPSKTQAFDDILQTRTTTLLTTALTALESTFSTQTASLSALKTKHAAHLAHSTATITHLTRSLSSENLEFQNDFRAVTDAATLGGRIRRFQRKLCEWADEDDGVLEGLWREWEGVRGEIEALRSEIFGNGNGSGDGDREGEGGDEFEAAIRELQEKLEGDVRAMGAEAVMGMVASEKESDLKSRKQQDTLLQALAIGF